MKKKKIFVVLATFLFIAISMTTNTITAFADDKLFNTNYGSYGDKVYYNIDYIDTTELEEEDEGFFDRFNVFSNLKGDAVGFIYNLIHKIFIEFPFFLLKTGTTATIWLFNKIYEVNFVNSIVKEISFSIQSMAGISNGSFKTTGLFGGFLGIITMSVAIYTLYQFIVKKASISAFSGLIRSLIALVMALAFFTNYSTIINGMNTLSVETSKLIISGSMKVNDKGNISNESAQKEMNAALWDTFVQKPYLMLQYGSMDESSIGKTRIKELLKLKPDTEDRYDYVQKEVTDKKNEMMTREKIMERGGILVIATLADFVNSIPIIILAFALLFFQFWFTALAMIAPFVFVWSAFPNQFKVLTRYLLELITPLVLKVGLSVIALFVFSLTSLLSDVSMKTINTDGLLSYIFLVFMESILLFTIFILRHRIAGIFSAGSKQLAFVRENMSSAFQPVKKGVQTTATAVGTAVGAMNGGLQGAMVGSHIGSNIGQIMTGDKGLGEAGKDLALSHKLYDSLKNNKRNEKQSLEDEITGQDNSGQQNQNIKDQENEQKNEHNENKYANLNELLEKEKEKSNDKTNATESVQKEVGKDLQSLSDVESNLSNSAPDVEGMNVEPLDTNENTGQEIEGKKLESLNDKGTEEINDANAMNERINSIADNNNFSQSSENKTTPLKEKLDKTNNVLKNHSPKSQANMKKAVSNNNEPALQNLRELIDMNLDSSVSKESPKESNVNLNDLLNNKEGD